MAVANCPAPADLERLYLGGVPENEATRLEQHVLTCGHCLEKVKALAPTDDLLSVVLAGKESPRPAPLSLAVESLMQQMESLRPSRAEPPLQGTTMIKFSCSACAKTLSVKETLSGKKVKCPGCGQVTAVPAVQVVAAPQGGAEERTLPPSLLPEPESRLDPDKPATLASSSDAEATEGVRNEDTGEDNNLIDFLSPPQSNDELGRLGKYRILKILGHGGMGVVYKAEDPKLMRTVALKAMLPALAASASAGKRFLREAQAMAAVEHDHIVRIYQVDEDRNVPYMAMEFLKGEPLDERLKRDEKMPLDEVLRIGREIARGLDAAHKTGLIHRDIKPGNIWLEAPEGRVKILDFGLARAASQDSGLTQQGAIIGTPAYMAPEQGRGEAVDGRTDLFSLGVILYRLCSGQQPFRGNDTVSTIMEVALHEPPPPRALNVAIPPELSELVMKLLEKDPAKRIASARQVVATLQAIEKKLQQGDPFEGTQPVRVSPPPRRRPRVMVAVAALFAVVALAAGIVYFMQTPKGTIRIEIDDPNIEVTLTKTGASVKGVDKHDIKLEPGEHGFTVKRGDLEFQTDRFVLNKGETITLKVEWLKEGTLQVLQGGKVVGSKTAKAEGEPGVPMKGQTSLFNGKDFTGFTAADNWKVQDGVFIGRKTGPLVTQAEFTDFELSFQFQWEAKEPVGRSKPSFTFRPDSGTARAPHKASLSFHEDKVQAIIGTSARMGTGTKRRINTFNDVLIRCEGKRVKVVVNGETLADDVYTLPPSGRLEWDPNKHECTLKDIRITDLTKSSGTPLFNGKDFTGFTAGDAWKVVDSVLVGEYDGKMITPRLLTTRTDFTDFELTFRFKYPQQETDEGKAPLFVFRKGMGGVKAMLSFMKDRITLSPGFRHGKTGFAKPRENDFNEVWIRCVGKHMKVVVNGETLADGEFDTEPYRITWSTGEGKTVYLKDIRFTDLGKPTGALQFNGKDFTGFTAGASWKVQDDVLKGESGVKAAGSRTLKTQAEYTDFEMSFRFKYPLQEDDEAKASRFTFRNGLAAQKGMLTFQKDRIVLSQVFGKNIVKTATPNKEDFNDVWIRCEGNRTKVVVNGTTLADGEYDTIPTAPLTWLIGESGPVYLKDVRVTDLSKTSATPPRPSEDDWLKEVAAMPAEQQVEAVVAKLKERNPGYDGKETHVIGANQAVRSLTITSDAIMDISPVRALTKLDQLVCRGTNWGRGTLVDLSPLKEMNLTQLDVQMTKVADLSPLEGMKLASLYVTGTEVKDLSVVKDMPIANLSFNNTKVNDFSPIKDLPIITIRFDVKQSPVSTEANLRIVRSIKSLTHINGKATAEFWKEVDDKK